MDLEALRKAVIERDGEAFPSRSLADLVMKPAYDEAKSILFGYMHQVNRAHQVRLFECGIISTTDVAEIQGTLDGLPGTILL